MDEADLGNQFAEIYRQQAMRDYLRRNKNTPSAAMQHLGGDPLGSSGVGASEPHICLDCGDEIDPARIKANPAAVRCIDCQTKYERRAGRG